MPSMEDNASKSVAVIAISSSTTVSLSPQDYSTMLDTYCFICKLYFNNMLLSLLQKINLCFRDRFHFIRQTSIC